MGYTDNDIKENAKRVHSLAGLLRALGLKPAGGNYANMKRKLQKLQIDTNHWTGQGWSKDEQLKDWSNYKRTGNIKKHLIKKRGHKCEKCKGTEWFGPIPLEIHHVDGDRTNNELENLQLLCCNCHATTDNWRNKKRT